MTINRVGSDKSYVGKLLIFYIIIMLMIVHIIDMFQNAQWQKPIFQELISRILFEIETRGQVFCIALGPVTICIATRTIGLLYLFYNTR